MKIKRLKKVGIILLLIICLFFNMVKANTEDEEDININLGSPVNIVDGVDPKLRTELEMFVDDLLEVTEFPKDATLQSKYAIVRYQVLSALRMKFPETDGWNIQPLSEAFLRGFDTVSSLSDPDYSTLHRSSSGRLGRSRMERHGRNRQVFHPKKDSSDCCKHQVS